MSTSDALPVILAGLGTEKRTVELKPEEILELLALSDVCSLTIPFTIKESKTIPSRVDVPESMNETFRVAYGKMYAEITEVVQVPAKSILSKVKMEDRYESKHVPIVEAIKKYLPENVAILSLVIDRFRKEVRILYLPRL